MIEIKKDIEIIINKEDVEILKEIFEFARCWISQKKINCDRNIIAASLGVTVIQLNKIDEMMEKIFDA